MSELDALIRDAMGDARWWRYFNQSKRWQPDNNRVAANIVDMPPEWRLNCVRFLERRATRYAAAYAKGCEAETLNVPHVMSGEMAQCSITRELEEEADWARTNPDEWIRATPLYRALAAGLPARGRELRALEQRAAHWSGCEWRAGETDSCSCARLRQEHGAAKWAHVDAT